MDTVGFILTILWIQCWYRFFLCFGFMTESKVSVGFEKNFRLSTYVVAVALFLWAVFVWARVMEGEYPVSLCVAWLGVVIVFIGQELMCAARRELKTLSNHDLLFSISKKNIRTGIYRHMRHPMYAGLIVALTGTSIALNDLYSLAVLVFILIPVIIARAHIELSAK